jgi:hypothetical protein
MAFELRVREGDPDTILAAVERTRPEWRRVPRDERLEGDVRVITGDLLGPSNKRFDPAP